MKAIYIIERIGICAIKINSKTVIEVLKTISTRRPSMPIVI